MKEKQEVSQSEDFTSPWILEEKKGKQLLLLHRHIHNHTYLRFACLCESGECDFLQYNKAKGLRLLEEESQMDELAWNLESSLQVMFSQHDTDGCYQLPQLPLWGWWAERKSQVKVFRLLCKTTSMISNREMIICLTESFLQNSAYNLHTKPQTQQ